MNMNRLLLTAAFGIMLCASSGRAQTTGSTTIAAQEPVKQKTDGEAPTVIGPGSAAYKQKTDGEAPTVIGPGSAAYKQKTDGEAPTVIGPGSGAYQK